MNSYDSDSEWSFGSEESHVLALALIAQLKELSPTPIYPGPPQTMIDEIHDELIKFFPPDETILHKIKYFFGIPTHDEYEPPGQRLQHELNRILLEIFTHCGVTDLPEHFQQSHFQYAMDLLAQMT
jgi:hypothetical protein